ncbi:GntR family transcriptional regulator [Intestinibacillus massiliensis]|uniref:GntR family transcriptional regulator n=1 Tax=Intestinibacillus massiliensis TaxID=1871029 RepID=UPI000B34D55D|nr:GntR family transcriptional regulator [Intestinibacillus massiliensis]MCB6365020.1 GntR family transcriptional regulator [Intestinibacillus massiliensis]
MDLIISNADGRPIYEQIATQVKGLILTGGLRPGDALPSMRTLAKDLRISVITTKRAYEELENDGYIYSQTGRGSFVAERNPELLREEQLRIIETHLQKAVDAARLGQLTLSEFLDIATTLFQEES